MSNRYIRQILVRDFGGAAQAKLAGAHIALIGLGGIGSPAALYLAAAGIGAMTIFEDDHVDESNLHRQVLFAENDIGKPKAEIGTKRLMKSNPDIKITNAGRFTEQIVNPNFDLLLDGSDSLETRHMASAFAVTNNIPLLSASLAQWEGQIAHFHPTLSGGCYHCLYPEGTDASAIPNCSEAGVIGPVAGMVGTWAALEAIKIITGANPLPPSQMLLIDGAYRETRIMNIAKRQGCSNCG